MRRDRLRVDHPRGRVFLLPLLGADPPTQGVHDDLPGAILLPGIEVIPYRGLGQQVVRQVGPLAARAGLVQEGVHHLPQVDRPLPPAGLGGRKQRLQDGPLRVGQVAGVRLSVGHFRYLFRGCLGAASPSS